MEVTILGNNSGPEYEAAEQLAKVFKEDLLIGESGKIIIAVGVTCFGQKVKDIDLVVVGQFDKGFRRKVSSRAMKDRTEEKHAERSVYFNNFCFCIEVKDHPSDRVMFQGGQAFVRYKNNNFHNATVQSNEQKYSLLRYLQDKIKLKRDPRICNFIWFRNMEKPNSVSLPHNYLWAKPSLSEVLQLACLQNFPSYFKGYYSFTAFDRFDPLMGDFNNVISFLSDIQKDVGQLTRSRLERITKKLLKDQQYAQAIGNKLVVVRGRAGTGKTIKLLHMAYDLCEQDHRCLILTYNKALVSDIKRLIALAGIKNDIAEATIEVRTVHSFLFDLLLGFGVFNTSLEKAKQEFKHKLLKDPDITKVSEDEIARELLKFEERFFLSEYESLKNELIDYIKQGILTETDVQSLMKKEHEHLDWDYIFIDESQDWPENEREILFSVFKSNQFIIADGVDQLVRGIRRSQWTRGIESHIDTKGQRKSLRQKANLCRFNKAYSDYFGLNWDVDPSTDLPGGKVIITTRPYDKLLNERLVHQCEEDGNKPYEMMFLVPPRLVQKKEVKYQKRGVQLTKTISCFSLTEEWKAQGTEIWDGTTSDLRTEYPTDVKQHRVLQYDSSRGLEGWIVVCMEMDDFFEYKVKTFKDDGEGQQTLALISKDEEILNWAHQWVMIPATRAIDTLVIHLRQKNSRFANLLKEVTKQFSDFVEWLD
ncbi:AAA family ATPase [Paenibacillus filicis]|uniref:AAA family ATPase n=1 Tax=Paenibacillus filicis TaxID=669464 RepID=A0ABU9DPV2_9BACL